MIFKKLPAPGFTAFDKASEFSWDSKNAVWSRWLQIIASYAYGQQKLSKKMKNKSEESKCLRLKNLCNRDWISVDKKVSNEALILEF